MGGVTGRTLKLQKLRDEHACLDQLMLFKVKFGDSVLVTEERAVACVDDFEWGWCAMTLLSAAGQDRYYEFQDNLWRKTRDETFDTKAYREGLARRWARIYIEEA
jgi:hypothetical protein